MVNQEFKSNLNKRAIVVLMATAVAVGLLNVAPSRAGVHDPMRPQAEYIVGDTASAAKPEFHLEATMVSSQRRVAIIDGSTVSIGDKYHEHLVASIDEGCVVLAQRGKKTSLTLQPTIKTRTAETSETLHHIRGVD